MDDMHNHLTTIKALEDGSGQTSDLSFHNDKHILLEFRT